MALRKNPDILTIFVLYVLTFIKMYYHESVTNYRGITPVIIAVINITTEVDNPHINEKR